MPVRVTVRVSGHPAHTREPGMKTGRSILISAILALSAAGTVAPVVASVVVSAPSAAVAADVPPTFYRG